jgi:uroporphyrinogen-III synthase
MRVLVTRPRQQALPMLHQFNFSEQPLLLPGIEIREPKAGRKWMPPLND